MHSELNVPNLITLANGLLNDSHRPGTNFDMWVFSDPRGILGSIDYEWYGNSDLTECGSIGCAIGHAPFYGITKCVGESWMDYSRRTLIHDKYGYEDAWSWCFDGNWKFHDNTKEGAAKRIIYMLQYGVPENWRADRADTIKLYKDITGFCPQWLKENS